ncbi:MAG: sigma-70 family RNA polymerase sigma factor [Defluviitaleaceae bacterium]|nr:sigma-70 family RNA polymerase sigma factor [Defluviitaleaceae bacterium]
MIFLTDFELIQLCLNGQTNYFSDIVDRYKNLIYSMVLKMINDKEEANDLAQEIFIKMYNNLHKYSPEYKLSTWIMRITQNHVIDFRRKKKQEHVCFEEVEFELSQEASAENAYLEKERLENIENAVDSLPDMYKTPIVLYHEKGYSYQEISDITNEPLSKVKNRIFRGRKMLKDLLTFGEVRS